MGPGEVAVGSRFGRWVVTEASSGPRTWCRCDCGTEKVVATKTLRSGKSRSCGCQRRDLNPNLSHGGSYSPEYRAWRHMINRCTNPKVPCYERYGGRGIGVCERWRHDFAAFLTDVGPRPSPDHTLGRIDNDGNYEPGNVRWETWSEQSRNRSNTTRIEANGETLTTSEWSERTGVPIALIHSRIRLGWEPARAVTTPVNSNRSAGARRRWQRSRG